MTDRNTAAMGPGDRSRTGDDEGLKEKAGDAKERAQEKLSDAAAEVRDRGSDLVEEGKEKAQELGERAGEMARSQGDHQRERVAEGVRTFADALRRGNHDLPEDRREYGRFIDTVADRVEGVSRYLEEHDVDTLTREARRFAREQTPVFLSGAFTLGMLGARFLKSSGDQARAGGHDDDRSRGDRSHGGRYSADRYDRDRYGAGPSSLESPRSQSSQRWTAPSDPAEPYDRDRSYPSRDPGAGEGGHA